MCIVSRRPILGETEMGGIFEKLVAKNNTIIGIEIDGYYNNNFIDFSLEIFTENSSIKYFGFLILDKKNVQK